MGLNQGRKDTVTVAPGGNGLGEAESEAPGGRLEAGLDRDLAPLATRDAEEGPGPLDGEGKLPVGPPGLLNGEAAEGSTGLPIEAEGEEVLRWGLAHIGGVAGEGHLPGGPHELGATPELLSTGAGGHAGRPQREGRQRQDHGDLHQGPVPRRTCHGHRELRIQR